MERKDVWGIWGGAALIGLGILFLAGQFLNVNLMRYLWPFFIIAAGGAFFVGMLAGGRAMGALAVPGSVILTVGLILLLQNLFGFWSTWSYAWALIISGAGVGLMIFGSWSDLPDLRRAGRVVIGVGLGLFLIFGLFFELGASLLGLRSPGGIFWPVALILVGLYVLFGRAFFNQVSGPVSRTAVDFHPLSAVPVEGSQGTERLANEAAPVSVSPVDGIRNLRFRALGDMTIIQGEREGLEIEAPAAVKERIHSEVRGDTLEIRYEQDWLDWLNPRFWNISTLHYTLYVRELLSLDLAGLGNLVIRDLSTSRLELKHSGTGNVSIRHLEAGSLAVRQAGLGNIEINGQVERQDVELTGTGSYQARSLESRAANVRLSGLGSAVVCVSEDLDAHVSGTGSIEYSGNPRVNPHVSGLGGVRRIGNH